MGIDIIYQLILHNLYLLLELVLLAALFYTLVINHSLKFFFPGILILLELKLEANHSLLNLRELLLKTLDDQIEVFVGDRVQTHIHCLIVLA